MVARLLRLLQGGVAQIRRAARTEYRRPAIIAAAAGIAVLQLLPAGIPLQQVRLMSPGGWVERSFTLPLEDPRLESLRRAAAAAGKPNYAQRSDDYYRAQWDMEAAEFYAGHSPATEAAPLATQPIPPADSTLTAVSAGGATTPTSAPANAVTQVSFDRPQTPAEPRDWKLFWETVRETSAARLQSLEPAPAIDPAYARLQFGELVFGPLPTSSVFASLCVAAFAFAAAQRWVCAAPQRRIALRSRQPLMVPRQWFRQRRSLRDWTAALTRGRIAEGAAAAALVAVWLGAWLSR